MKRTLKIEDKSEIIDFKEWDDKDGRRQKITHQNKLVTNLLLEPSQEYIDTKLKPMQRRAEERKRIERTSILATLLQNRDALNKSKSDSSIPIDYRNLMQDKLEGIEAQIEKIKEEMQN